MKFWLVLHEFFLSGTMPITKPEVVTTMRRNEIEMQICHLNIRFRGRESQWNIDRHEVMFSSAWIFISGKMPIIKPEVVTTMRRNEIKIQIWQPHIGFRGCPSQWSIDRLEVLQGSDEFCLPRSKATTKLEVVTTMQLYYYTILLCGSSRR